MKKTIYVLLVAVMIITACQSKNKNTPIDTLAEADVLRKIEAQWVAAIKTKDTDKILSIFAPEAVVMNTNTPACVGLQSIRKSQESWFLDTTIFHSTFTSSVDTIEVSASGDLAYARGNSQLNISTPNGIVEETDKWITIYRKINGEWKAIVDIWNSDKPMEGQ
jgi:ketosteroid isomerase-like protein